MVARREVLGVEPPRIAAQAKRGALASSPSSMVLHHSFDVY